MVIKELPIDDARVLALIDKLDQYQLNLYGDECCSLESPQELSRQHATMLGAFDGDNLLGIGSIKICEDPQQNYGEIKRMYFEEAARKMGVASQLIKRLEEQVFNAGITQVYLETGYLQKAAINFYYKHGYTLVEKFGSYQPNRVSVYMGKQLVALNVKNI